VIGDKLVITEYHRDAGKRVFRELEARWKRGAKFLSVTIAGESGCGKSETAQVLSELCEGAGRKTVVLAQDDYFHLPPHANARKREEFIGWVGPGEVRLDLLKAHVEVIRSGEADSLVKPCSVFERDEIIDETLDVAGAKVVIAEGTYTTLLPDMDVRVFIDRVYTETKKARLRRGRDAMSEFVETVLAIEHGVIREHKKLATIVIPPPEGERVAESERS
jgi:uridine kinase